MKINVLGTEYTIAWEHNTPRMALSDGFCDETTKEIVVENYEGDDGKPGVKAQLDIQRKKNTLYRARGGAELRDAHHLPER